MANLGQGAPTNNPTFRAVAQATLEYAGVPMSICRMQEYDCQPENSFDNADYLGINRVTIGVTAVVNPAALASLSGQNPPGVAGDRAGITMQNLRQVLMQKRQTLIYRVGPDVELLSPQAPTLLSDAKNGPNPLALRILEVHGAKTALIYFRIETWVGGNTVDPTENDIVLSNRWTAEASVDDDWKTTIRLSGRMRLRTDVLQDRFRPATPDIFRQSVLPTPVPAGFKRRVPLIRILPDGSELEWECIDEQQFLNLGTNSGATRVEGQVTCGADVGYQDFKDLVKAVMASGNILNDVVGGLWAIFATFFPAVRNTFQLRVYGPPQGNRRNLVNIALQIVLDRFAPQLANGLRFGDPFSGGLVSLYLTTPIDKGHIELRGAVLGTFGAAAAAFDPADWSNRMSIGDFNAPLGWTYDNATANPDPPNAGTSRGTYIGALLEAALLDDYTLPARNEQAERGANAADIGKDFQ